MKNIILSLKFLALFSNPLASTYVFAQDDENNPKIEEITVTGEKFERSLQDTVSSVAVFDAETINNQNFTDLFDVINQTANVAGIGSGNAGNDTGFSIRGLRNSGVLGADSTSDVATVYLDGVFLPSNLFATAPLNLWDVESVEIFRGPQSTIQGRNALIGAVVARTVDPSSEFDGSAQLRVSEFDSLRASGAVSIPIVQDQLALRLSSDYTETDGFVENLTLGTDDAAGEQVITSRAKLLFTPDAAPNFLARFNFSYIDVDEETASVDEPLFPDQLVTFQNIPDLAESETILASTEIEYELNDVFNLTTVTSFIETDRSSSLDLDAEPLDPAAPDNPVEDFDDDTVFSQEIRLTFETERWSGLVGAYYFNSSNENQVFNATGLNSSDITPDDTTLAQLTFQTLTPTPEQIAQISMLSGLVTTFVPIIDVDTESFINEDIENAALFGEVNFDVTEKLTLTLGARIDFENVTQDFSVSQQVLPINLDLPPGLLDAMSEAIVMQTIAATIDAFTIDFNLDADNDFSAFLPKGVITYNWTDNLATSFSVQRAYRAGGLSFNEFQIAAAGQFVGDTQEELEVAGIVNSFDPEFTTNFELSFRSQWFDRRLTVNANVFYIDYDDQQINIIFSPNPLDTLTDNVGNSRLRGFEIETALNPTPNWSLFANLGFNDTEFLESSDLLDTFALDGEPDDLTGLRFTGAPDLTIGLGGRYTHQSGFFANLRVRRNGDAEGNVFNAPSAVVEAHTIVDVILGYEINDKFFIEVFANNLLDEQFLAFNPIAEPNGSIGPGAFALPGQQRVLGARVAFNL